MNENQNNKDIKSLVLEKIETGKINMRPHFYFVLQVVALIVVAVLTLLVSSFLVSFMIFSLIASGKLILLGFGLRGLWMFFLLFPWTLLVVEVALIILLEWLIKKFRFGYRASLSRLVFLILLISILISVIIDVTPLHLFLLRRAEQRNLPVPFVGGFYRGIRRPTPDQEIFRGIVANVSTSSFVLNQVVDIDDSTSSQTYIVDLPPGVPQAAIPMVGDTIFVAGHLSPDNTIQAYGFQKLPTTDSQ